MMASSNDLIKYFTEQIVRYLDTPKENRPKKEKESLSYHWFGLIPLSLSMIFQKIIRRILLWILSILLMIRTFKHSLKGK